MENLKDHSKQFQVAEIQLSYSLNVKPSLRPKISHSNEACQILKQGWNESKLELLEQFKVMLLNRANKYSESLKYPPEESPELLLIHD